MTARGPADTASNRRTALRARPGPSPGPACGLQGDGTDGHRDDPDPTLEAARRHPRGPSPGRRRRLLPPTALDGARGPVGPGLVGTPAAVRPDRRRAGAPRLGRRHRARGRSHSHGPAHGGRQRRARGAGPRRLGRPADAPSQRHRYLARRRRGRPGSGRPVPAPCGSLGGAAHGLRPAPRSRDPRDRGRRAGGGRARGAVPRGLGRRDPRAARRPRRCARWSRAPGFLLAGGEQGLWRVETSRALRLETPDPWIESVGLLEGEVLAATAAGLARGRPEGRIALGPRRRRRGFRCRPRRPSSGPSRRRRWTRCCGSSRADGSPRNGSPRSCASVMTAAGTLLADTDDGLFRRDADGLAKDRGPAARPCRPADRTWAPWPSWAGGSWRASSTAAWPSARRAVGLDWRAVPGSRRVGRQRAAARGRRALRGEPARGRALRRRAAPPARGARRRVLPGRHARRRRDRLRPGRAASRRRRLLSAFHGLPGNQALALAGGREPLRRHAVGPGRAGRPARALAGDVGRRQAAAPVGHGARRSRRTACTSAPTAAASCAAARRAVAAGRALADPARYEPFPETDGLKVNPGCLVEADGRLYAGTDGRGLWRLVAGPRRLRAACACPCPRRA